MSLKKYSFLAFLLRASICLAFTSDICRACKFNVWFGSMQQQSRRYLRSNHSVVLVLQA